MDALKNGCTLKKIDRSKTENKCMRKSNLVLGMLGFTSVQGAGLYLRCELDSQFWIGA